MSFVPEVRYGILVSVPERVSGHRQTISTSAVMLCTRREWIETNDTTGSNCIPSLALYPRSAISSGDSGRGEVLKYSGRRRGQSLHEAVQSVLAFTTAISPSNSGSEATC